jgi:hypothetical protein
VFIISIPFAFGRTAASAVHFDKPSSRAPFCFGIADAFVFGFGGTGKAVGTTVRVSPS